MLRVLALISVVVLLLLLAGCGGNAAGPAMTYAPPTLSLTASPTVFSPGESVTLTWVSEHADTVVASNFGEVGVQGSMEVSPLDTHTYSLTVSGPGGIAEDSVTVNIRPTVTLVVDPLTIAPGGMAMLSWTSSRATRVVASSFGETDLKGSTVVSPAQTTTYTMTVANDSGQEATGTCTLTVDAAP